MRRFSLLIPLAGCILSVVSERAVAAPSPYSTMIVFGDSLSDSGHYPGVGSGMRFTNLTGPTYKEYRGEEYAGVAPTRLGIKLGIAPADLRPSTGVLQGSCRVSRVFKLLFSLPAAPSLG